jgi:hypothetical protein
MIGLELTIEAATAYNEIGASGVSSIRSAAAKKDSGSMV